MQINVRRVKINHLLFIAKDLTMCIKLGNCDILYQFHLYVFSFLLRVLCIFRVVRQINKRGFAWTASKGLLGLTCKLLWTSSNDKHHFHFHLFTSLSFIHNSWWHDLFTMSSMWINQCHHLNDDIEMSSFLTSYNTWPHTIPGVSIKFEVDSLIEQSSRLYQLKVWKKSFFNYFNLGKIVADFFERICRCFSSVVGAYWKHCDTFISICRYIQWWWMSSFTHLFTIHDLFEQFMMISTLLILTVCRTHVT